ncbi:hypothetical protein L202_08117 [Cryptococcus amylolentus CBS 6039]|uniref:GPI transamidase component GAA1 n=2 Tax=Cryptococcus amylolentus TaxID=104669 RepID=A0A1E3H8L6_9TREE|nr:hypothetical protein L202_08117 [Cryptococcus amylolentus CBS 6039]ODN72678.1 hypothetical protein L202_08117 [Cryptococcus amylolentus CBS 6039]ODN97887.1 hypothetical protein I350_07522 [Cryptococcus amylolentus CBS 6273]
MLARIRNRLKAPVTPPDPEGVNYTKEHVSIARTIRRRQKILGEVWRRLGTIQWVLILAGMGWLLALPYEGLWRGTYVDEHALQPAQVTVYFDWANVHKADLYLGELERIVNTTFEERTEYLQRSFSESGLHTSNTSTATYAHVSPPRSAGTETILVSANWVSRDGGPNLRGIATMLAMGDFMRGQNYWAFDFVLVIGEGYQTGLADFMEEFSSLFSGKVWTGVNIDYPGHSFSHLGLFYEGTNGRLPNQDTLNTFSRVASSMGVPVRYHNIPDEVEVYRWPFGWLGQYLLAAKHLLHHLAYAGLGRGSGGHGPMARHRIDSYTIYATPATGPHGFHSLGRTLESTLRSYNNLLERLHASYFFYLLPRPGRFLEVGKYLPAAVLMGAGLTLGGLDVPRPLEAAGLLGAGGVVAGCVWLWPLVYVLLPLSSRVPRPTDDVRKSTESLLLLTYGALVPTLAMINFPQAVILALISIISLKTHRWVRFGTSLVIVAAMSVVLRTTGMDMGKEWEEVGNLVWPGVHVVLLPLCLVNCVLTKPF